LDVGWGREETWLAHHGDALPPQNDERVLPSPRKSCAANEMAVLASSSIIQYSELIAIFFISLLILGTSVIFF
jgi:hypothetical protein